MSGLLPPLRKVLLIAFIVLSHGIATAQTPVTYGFIVPKESKVAKISLNGSDGGVFEVKADGQDERVGKDAHVDGRPLYNVSFEGKFKPSKACFFFENGKNSNVELAEGLNVYEVGLPDEDPQRNPIATTTTTTITSTTTTTTNATGGGGWPFGSKLGLLAILLVVFFRMALGVAVWLLWMVDGAPPPPDWPFALSDSYRQLRPHRKFASGGMADIWSAQLTPRWSVLGLGWSGKVAVKILKQGFFRDARIREAFHAEPRFLLATARTRVVPRVRCLCTRDFHTPFYAMDSLVKMNRLRDKIGGPGRDTTDTPGAFPVFALRIGLALLDAIDRIHRTGCVHLDVSPENVMYVIGRNRRIRIILIDFGLAKAIPEICGPASYVKGGDFTGLGCGRPNYSAPELLKDWALADARSDAYSAGVVLWECIFGEIPNRQTQQLPQKLIACGISEPLAVAIVQMLAIDPASRPSVRAVADRIDKELRRRYG